MLQRLRNLFASPPPRPTRPTQLPLRGRGHVSARYDAAATTDENRRHWASADQLSVNAANSPAVRRVLRSRSRYEVANNAYARGITSTLANDVVGTGPRLQLLTDNPATNRQAEQAFAEWADAVGLPEHLRTLRASRCESGEVFAILAENPRLDSPVHLDLRLIEADQVATPGIGVGRDRLPYSDYMLKLQRMCRDRSGKNIPVATLWHLLLGRLKKGMNLRSHVTAGSDLTGKRAATGTGANDD